MNVVATIAPVEIVQIRPIEKEKSSFQPVTTIVLKSAKLYASLSSILVLSKQSTVTTDCIIPRDEIVGTEFR